MDSLGGTLNKGDHSVVTQCGLVVEILTPIWERGDGAFGFCLGFIDDLVGYISIWGTLFYGWLARGGCILISIL